jgi:hypothetical protein
MRFGERHSTNATREKAWVAARNRCAEFKGNRTLARLPAKKKRNEPRWREARKKDQSVGRQKDAENPGDQRLMEHEPHLAEQT